MTQRFNWQGRCRRMRLEQLEDRRLLSLPKWTFMAYLDGDCDLEEYALACFRQLAAVGSSQDVNIVVQLDRIPGYVDDYGGWNDTRRGMVLQGDQLATWGTSLGELNMGAPKTVYDFVTWAMAYFPAERYALVFVDHGSGVNDGVCHDHTSGHNALQTGEMWDALGMYSLDLIGFDACWGAGVELAYQIHLNGQVMVASAHKEPSGWAYQGGYREILTELRNRPHMDAVALGREIVEIYRRLQTEWSYSTLTAIDLKLIPDLFLALDELAAYMVNTAGPEQWDCVMQAHSKAKNYEGGKDLYDIGDWMIQIQQTPGVSPTVSALAARAFRAANDSVIALYPGDAESSHMYGISVYAPFARLHPRYDPALEGKDIAFVAITRWAKFVGPRGINAAEVIDCSGSMLSGGKIEAAKAAAKEFIDLMYPYDRLTVVSYSDSARVKFPLQPLAGIKDKAKAAVDGLSAYGGTSIGAGIRAAAQQLQTTTVPSTRAILLMSDGKENVGPWSIPVIQSDVHEDTIIHTIGFGEDADAFTLSVIAGMRKGQYYYAADLGDLVLIYHSLATRVAGLQQGPRTTQTIRVGQEVRHNVPVDLATGYAVFTMDMLAGDVELTLVAPDGTVIDPTTPASNPYVTYESDATYKIYTIALPMVGQWQMVARGVTVPAQGQAINLYASLDSPVCLSMSTDKLVYEAGQVIHIQAALADIEPILGATVTATIAAPSGSALAGLQITLYDDGLHNDGAADDGVYANQTLPLDKTGSYTISVDARGMSYWDVAFARSDFHSVYTQKPTGRQVTTVDMTPESLTTRVGQQQVFTITARDRDGNPCVMADPIWDVYDPVWETPGGGTLVPNGAFCTFTATQPGHWRIVCYDATDQAVRASATVLVAGISLVDGHLQIVGSSGNDTVSAVQVGSSKLRVYASFLDGASRVRQFASREVSLIQIYGGPGRDILQAANASVPVWIDGGSGNDMLWGGRAADIIFGGPGNDMLWGGNGADILLGGDDNDILFGEGGRNLLIGGGGRDRLFAGSTGDILIGGKTTFSDPAGGSSVNRTALLAILAEWSSTRSRAARRANILNGSGSADRLNDDYFLQLGSTVLDDRQSDSYFAIRWRDWYLTS